MSEEQLKDCIEYFKELVEEFLDTAENIIISVSSLKDDLNV